MSVPGVDVSVVIPCFRCGAYIARTIASLAAQTAVPARVILVDDCSGDDTLLALQRVAACYDPGWIEIVAQKENGGAAVARNAGWALVETPLLAFLDADDQWHPRKLEIQLAALGRESSADFIGVGSTMQFRELYSQPPPLHQISLNSLLLRNRFCTSGVLLKTQLQLRFNESKRRSEDYLLWLEIARSGASMFLLEAPLVLYPKAMLGAGGLTGNVAAMRHAEFDTYRKFWQSGGISTPVFAALCAWLACKAGTREILRRL